MCSFWMDNFERVVVHLAHRDVTLIAYTGYMAGPPQDRSGIEYAQDLKPCAIR
jgi:hypothetical protein